MNNTSPANPGIKWGLIAGLVSVALSVLIWVLNRDLLFSFWLGIIMLVAYIVFAVLAGRERKQQLGGYMEFKQGLQAIFLTFVIGGFIGAIYQYITYNIIDPTLPDQMKHHTMETMEKMLRRFGAPQEKIDEQLDKINEQDFRMGPGKIFMSFLYSLIFYFIVASIISLILRKKRPADISIDDIGTQP